MTVRTRCAPSPTGVPHLGTAYIALFNLCFARSQQGQFILRTEDTDRQRSSSHYEQQIITALRWLGLDWDEGADVSGSYAPYRQSERTTLYRQYADQLLESGRAFYCFATPDQLQQMRSEQLARGETSHYDGRGRVDNSEQLQRRLKSSEPRVIRLEIPDRGSCCFEDMLRGEVSIDWRQVDSQVLLKSDQMPTYHLAAAVDDHLMGITHILRGEEWINSVPKQQLIYEALGWEIPQLCHLPLLRNTDHSKLSKRKNPTGLLYYRRIGILPEALLNYLARMGWSMPDEREQFSLQEMIDNFDISRFSLGAPIFDRERLQWLNGEWIRSMDQNQLLDRMVDWSLNRENLRQLLPSIQPRMKCFSDLVPLAGFLLRDSLQLSSADFAECKLPGPRMAKFFQDLAAHLEEVPGGDWTQDALFLLIKQRAKVAELSLSKVLGPLFIAITGSSNSFSVAEAMRLLGSDLTLVRLREAVAVLKANEETAAAATASD